MKPKSFSPRLVSAYNAKWAAIGSLINAPVFAPAVTETPAGITAINASMTVEGNFIQALTTYATGWRAEQGIDDLLRFIAPARRVGERFEYEQLTNLEAFLSNTEEDLRAKGSQFKELPPPTSTKVLAETANRGLQLVIENRNVAVKGAEHYISMLMERIKLNKLRRAFALLSATANNTAKTWDTTAGKDPDQDVNDQLLTAAAESGLRPNRVLFGETAWGRRKKAHRAQNTAGGFASAKMSPEEVATELNVDAIHIAKPRYASSASVRAEVVGNLVVMFSALDNESLTDPTNVLDFWSPCDQGGGQFAVYQWQVGAKFTAFAVEHYEKLAAVSDLGVEKFTVS